MDQLGPTLTEFYAPTTSSERKQQLEQGLHAFRTLPNAHLTSLGIIEATGQRREQEDLLVLYFCGCTVEWAIRRRWSSIPKDERLNARRFLFQYLAASHSSLPRWVVTKLGKALVDVGKVSWPREDPTFLAELQQLASNESTRVLGLDLLTLVSEEFVRPDSPLPDARAKELKASLIYVLPDVLRVLAEVVAGSRDPAAATAGQGVTEAAVGAAREAILGAARCLLVIVSWAPLSEHLTIDLFRSLFGVVEAAAHGTGEGSGDSSITPSLQECGATCVACVTEVVSKRLLPPAQQDMVLGMADHMLTLLKIVTSGGSIRAGLNDNFLMQMAEFMGAFMEANLGRVLGMGVSNAGAGGPAASSHGTMSSDSMSGREPYPVGELLSLLAVFTFSQPTTEGLQRCLRAWAAFVAQATWGEGDASVGDVRKSVELARDNAGGLQSVCQALLEKSLFLTNAAGLEELDDDSGDGGGKGDEGTGAGDWSDDDDGGGHGGGIRGASDAGGAGASELEEFIAEIRHVLLSSSRIPGVGAALSENVLGAFSTVLERLDQANASLSSTNSGNSGGDAQGAAAGQQARRLAADASTLCALMPATAAAAAAAGEDSSRGNEDGSSRGNGLILRAGQAVGQAAGAMAAAGLHGQGPEFAALQVAALGAISALLPEMAGNGDDIENATAIADSVVGLVRKCWESQGGAEATSGASVVSVAAGRLLLSLTTVLPPSALEASPAIGALLKDASQVGASLSAEAHVLLYQSLSAFLLPPKLLEGNMGKINDLEGRSRAYSELVAPILGPFSAVQAGWQGWTGPSPWPGFSDAGVSTQLSDSSRILSRLCRGFASTPAKARQVLYRGLEGMLAPLVALVPPFLETASKGSKEAASAARSLLRLQVSIVDCLGREAGPSFASQAVQSLSSAGGDGSDGAGPPWLSSGVFRLLTSVMRARNASTKALVPQACDLALRRLDALGRVTAGGEGTPGWGERWLEGPVVEALPDFLDLAKEFLVTQWHCFVPSKANRGMGSAGTTMASALSAHVQQSAAQSGGSSSSESDFSSATMSSHFSGLMSILLMLLSVHAASNSSRGSDARGGGSHSVPPDLVRRALAVLEASHRGGGLFRFPPFSSAWLQPFLTDTLRGLAEGAHHLLQDEVRHVIFDMAEVDHRAFVTGFLPRYLETSYSWLEASQREALVSPWRAGTHLDAPTFSSHLEAFVHDIAFFRAQAQAS